jgi:hypothetical protein
MSSVKRTFVGSLLLFLVAAFVSASFCNSNINPTGIYGGHTGSKHKTGRGFAGTEGRNIKRGFLVAGENLVSKLRPDVNLAKTYPAAADQVHKGVVSPKGRFASPKTFPSSLSPVLNI